MKIVVFAAMWVNLLRQHFGFKTHHLNQIKEILDDLKNIPGLRSKLMELGLKLAERRQSGQPIKNLPAWVIASVRKEYDSTSEIDPYDNRFIKPHDTE